MDMIGHENSRDDFPIPDFVRSIGKYGERLIVRQNRAPPRYAERQEINDRLIIV